MWVYGADFSGARDPSKRIYYARGLLERDSLLITEIVLCDDRLDLFSAIHRSRAPWGLDFPFSLSSKGMEVLGVRSWRELLEVVSSFNREEFFKVLEEKGLPSCERRCSKPSICCRITDSCTSSFSPLKKTNPMMRAMVYGGWKLLYYLSCMRSRVYPFHQLDRRFSRLYEVYPAHTWRELGLSRTIDGRELIAECKREYGFRVEFDGNLSKLDSLDAADAVVACITLGWVLDRYGLDEDWSELYSFITPEEWEIRSLEGVIVRVEPINRLPLC